jgi:hypothetical protein
MRSSLKKRQILSSQIYNWGLLYSSKRIIWINFSCKDYKSQFWNMPSWNVCLYVRWIANQDTVWFSTGAFCCRPIGERVSSSGVTTKESCFRLLNLGLTENSWIKTCKYRRRGHNLIHIVWFSFLIIVARIDTKEPYSCSGFMLQRDNSTRFFTLGFPAICPIWPLIQLAAFLHTGFEFSKLLKLLKWRDFSQMDSSQAS